MLRSAYSITGPHRGQDGRSVWHLVRTLPGGAGWPVMELMQRATAQRIADSLNRTSTPAHTEHTPC